MTKRIKKLNKKKKVLEKIRMKLVEKSIHVLSNQTCSFCISYYWCSKYEKQRDDYCSEWTDVQKVSSSYSVGISSRSFGSL